MPEQFLAEIRTPVADGSEAGDVSSLTPREREVIEQRYTVRFGPDADPARILECIVVPVERLFAVKRHGEVIVLKINP